MKAIIISAGSGTRLGKYTEKLPKGLLEINGTTILEKQISNFQKNGINDILIIIGPHKEKYELKNVTYLEDSEHQKHDVLQSLMIAENSIVGEIIISYSDIIFDNSILEQVIKSDVDIGIVIDLNWEEKYANRTEHPKSEADNVIIQNEKIIKIKKNISEVKSNQKRGEFIGIMKFSKKGSKIFVTEYNKIKQNHSNPFQNAQSFEKAYITDLIQELIDRGIQVSPIIINGLWCEIDTPQDLVTAKKLFRN